MRPPLHKHPCQGCQTPTVCRGAVSQNYDGSPEWVCDAFHLLTGGVFTTLSPDFLCEACADERDARGA